MIWKNSESENPNRNSKLKKKDKEDPTALWEPRINSFVKPQRKKKRNVVDPGQLDKVSVTVAVG